jgi:hypothetical protein
MRDLILGVLTNPAFLIGWGIVLVLSLAILLRDLGTRNSHLMSLMKVVWVFTVLYSGPLGLWVYWVSGRKEIADDAAWRRGFRSTAHCYSGCGAGEIVGVFIAAGLLSLGNWWVAIITFLLAYVAGFALTAGPLIQEGVSVRQALRDAFVSESASITVMELTAISVDLWLAQNATMAEGRFWASLVFSLSVGLLTAYPVNLLLIQFGLKEGMHSPKQMAHAQG